MKIPRAILIAGPTASGKSAAALALAERLGGTVINANSMQVYRELKVLTARPGPADLARAPHELYGFVPGREAYSAARYGEDAKAAIERSWSGARVPIVVGGTGLYFTVLLEGLSPVPPIPEAVRSRWRAEAARLGPGGLHAVLAERDAETAERLRPSDPQRIVRALEVLDATGRSLSQWHAEPGRPVLEPESTLRFVVAPDRETLNRRCNARFEAMIALGAIEEVEALARLDLDPELPIMRALGVRPLIQHIAGEIGREEAVEQAKAETRAYAKRQMTWIRSKMRAWNATSEQETERIVSHIINFIDSQA